MATTYNTGNAIGSADPRDAYDNASNFDEFINSSAQGFTDRRGVSRKTITGATAGYAAFNVTGAWTTATAYNVNDVWSDSGTFYLVLADYTSGASAAVDIAGGNVVVHQPKDWVVSVDTIADLRALEPAFDGQQVSLREDLVSGIFSYVSTSSASDDGVDVIVTVGDKRWVRVVGISRPKKFLTPDMFDGATDDLKFAAMKNAINTLGIKEVVLNRQYNISTFAIDTPMFISCEDGSAEILFSGTTGFNVTAEHSIKGIKFTTTLTTANGAPIGVYAFEDGETSGCTFNNCRLIYRNLTAAIKDNAITPDNKFFCDFTDFNPYVTESDCLSSRGFSLIVQDRCEFYVTNVNRVIKNGMAVYAFADGYADSSTSPKIIHQNRIKVRGSTGSSKQVFDHFTCQGGVYINNECDVEVTGFGTVYENKTNRSNAEVDTVEIISKPHYKNNGATIKIESTRGNTESAGIFAKGRKRVIISNDDLENTGSGAIFGGFGIIDVKYCDDFIYNGCSIKDKEGNNNQAIAVGSCRSVNLKLGNIVGGFVRFADTTGSQQGDTHSSVFDVISVSGGCFADCSNPLQGFIVLRGVVNSNLAVSITGASANNTTSLSSSGGLVCLRDMTAYSVTVNGCSIKQVSSVDERVYILNATVTKYLESGNSWQGTALP